MIAWQRCRHVQTLVTRRRPLRRAPGSCLRSMLDSGDPAAVNRLDGGTVVITLKYEPIQGFHAACSHVRCMPRRRTTSKTAPSARWASALGNLTPLRCRGVYHARIARQICSSHRWRTRVRTSRRLPGIPQSTGRSGRYGQAADEPFEPAVHYLAEKRNTTVPCWNRALEESSIHFGEHFRRLQGRDRASELAGPAQPPGRGTGRQHWAVGCRGQRQRGRFRTRSS